MDHYNTPECNSRMGYPAGFFDLQESQYHNGSVQTYAEFSVRTAVDCPFHPAGDAV
jgi:hypothetical protein